MGFVVSIWIMAYARRFVGGTTWLHLCLYGLLGIVSIYALGISWLAYCTHLSYAIQIALRPFFLIELVKLLATSCIICAIQKQH